MQLLSVLGYFESTPQISKLTNNVEDLVYKIKLSLRLKHLLSLAKIYEAVEIIKHPSSINGEYLTFSHQSRITVLPHIRNRPLTWNWNEISSNYSAKSL